MGTLLHGATKPLQIVHIVLQVARTHADHHEIKRHSLTQRYLLLRTILLLMIFRCVGRQAWFGLR